MRDAWRRMQVPIFGGVGILLMVLALILSLGLDVAGPQSGYALVVPTSEFSGASCDEDFYDPICCSDGVTYDNLCLCKASGATPEYQGICR